MIKAAIESGELECVYEWNYNKIELLIFFQLYKNEANKSDKS